MDVSIRQATSADADAIVRMHTLAHEECYGHLLPQAFFNARCESLNERIERRRPFLDSPDPRLVALDQDQEIVGLDWVLHDAIAGMAARVKPDLDAFPKEQAAAVEGLLENLGTGVATVIDARGFMPAEPWVGQHRRIPGLGTMVNKEDGY